MQERHKNQSGSNPFHNVAMPYFLPFFRYQLLFCFDFSLMVQWPKLVLFVLFCLKALLVPGMKDRFKFLQQSQGDMAKTQLLYHLTSLPGERESPSTRKGSPLVGLARLLLGCRLCGEHSDKLITLVHFAINIFAVNVAFS